MSQHIGVGGAWKPIVGDWIGVGGAWKRVSQEYIGVGGAWKLMYSALTVAAPDVSGSNSGFAASGSVTSSTCIPVVTYGSGSYTYSWAHVSTASGNTPSISNASVANVSWSATVTDGTQSVSTWRLTVTDTTYGISETDDVTVTLAWTNLS